MCNYEYINKKLFLIAVFSSQHTHHLYNKAAAHPVLYNTPHTHTHTQQHHKV